MGIIWSRLMSDKSFVPPSCDLSVAQNILSGILNMGIGFTVLIAIGLFFIFDPAGSIKHCPVNDKLTDSEAGRIFVERTKKGERRLYRSWRTR